jgi:tRNA pseudouridine13 synthase
MTGPGTGNQGPGADPPAVAGDTLLPGAGHFRVIEEPAYPACGSGEHLYLEIEKEGLTTDVVAQVLARACGVAGHAVGFAGRKDRHGITRQWFSVHFGQESRIPAVHADRGGSFKVVAVGRHKNKLRPGHLAGNQFRLGVRLADPDATMTRLAALAQAGIPNRFGAQRFGVNGSSLALARAWGAGDLATAVAVCVDPYGGWRPGDPLPGGFRHPPEGLVLGALRRRPEDPAGALRAGGDQMRKLAASAAQAAIFNAVYDARAGSGILHRLRAGDLALAANGAPFLVSDSDLDDVNRRAAPGVLDVVASGPLPGTWRLRPSPAVAAEEQAWAAGSGIDWTWLGADGRLESPGERRALVIRFRSPPTLAADADRHWLSFALPSGAYATEVLAAVGIAVPLDRR